MKHTLLVFSTGQLLGLALNFVIAPAALAAGYTFTTIDYPGSPQRSCSLPRRGSTAN
jgi:hypothetical protein